MVNVEPGTRWHRKRDTGSRHGNLVIVIKVIGNEIRFRESDIGRGFSRMPMGLFLGTFEPESATACQRCGSVNVGAGSRYCRDCLSLIGRVRNAKGKKEGDVVLTTTNNKLIEQKHEAEAQARAAAVAMGAPSVEAPTAAKTVSTGVMHWRITGRRVIVQEQTVVVDGATVIDALAAAEAQAPGFDVTDVHLLD